MRMSLLMALGASALVLAEDVAPVEKAPAESTQGIAVRNPFWPIGYEGKREVITAEVRVVPQAPEEVRMSQTAETAVEAAAAAAERAAAEQAAREAAAKAAAEKAALERIITPQHWVEARRALRIAGRVKVKADDGTERSSIMINGRAYADGDLISFTHGRNRFTWRVANLTSGSSVRLDRVRARHLEGDSESSRPASETSEKGVNE